MTARLTALGEAMLELSGPSLEQQRLGFAGDTLNTAIGLARLGIPTAYVTALGDDPYSQAMVAQWADEGLDVSAVAHVPGRLPGLYAIRTDAAGERRFFYWRRESPARQLFEGTRATSIAAALVASPWVYLSGITLAILEPAHRSILTATLERARAAGTRIAFDPNYRPALWASPEDACSAVMQVARLATIVLPTFDDDAACFGDPSPAACAGRYAGMGVPEVVVKCGADGALVCAGAVSGPVPAPAKLVPVDTSGAGDAFNAGYIAARLHGRPVLHAALAGHRLAAITLLHRGAIAPRQAVDAVQVLA